MSSSVRGLFITGTDTGVGKTRVASVLARTLTASGVRVGVYKPAASGCETVDGKLVSEDAVSLWEAAGRPGELDAVCPQRFAAPLAPHLAARAGGRTLDTHQLRTGFDYWRQCSEFVLVEGAGGWLCPLGDDTYVADLARDIGFPVVVVAPNILGTINQTLQTLFAIAHFRGGARVAGYVLNDIRPLVPERDPSVLTNADELARHAKTPLLARLGWQATEFDRMVDWRAVARISPS